MLAEALRNTAAAKVVLKAFFKPYPNPNPNPYPYPYP